MINDGVRVGGRARYHGKTYKVVAIAPNEHEVLLKDPANGETVRAYAFEVIAAASSRNAIVNAALAWKEKVVAENATAINAGRKTVKVELETVSFEKGVRSETRYMSIEEVRDLLKRLGKSGDADSFVSRLERQGASDIAINASDLYATLI